MMPGRQFLGLLVTFGAFQILFLFQIYYANVRQVPTQCDCQCTKQLHISTGNRDQSIVEESDLLRSVQLEERLSGVQRVGVDEEKQLKRILEAEDRKLDREWHKNKTQEEETEFDPEEEHPYSHEEKKKDALAVPAEKEYLTWRPLKLNSEINDTRSRCNGPHSDLLLVYVYSAPGHFSERDRVRNTWGQMKEHMGKRLRVVFFIGGLIARTKEHYSKIKIESDTYGDIVQDLSYVDAYRNLTLKGISAMQWVSQYCPEAYRVMKVDDDTMVNPFQLVKFLSGQSSITMSEIICKVTEDVGPIRDKRSKYYVSVDEYGEDKYPTYCQGYGYIFPPYVVPQILANINKKKLIAMEDVFFTGLVRETIPKLRVHTLTAMFATTFGKFETFLERITSRPELILIGHVHEDRSAEVFWQLAKQRAENQKKLKAASKKK